MKKIFETVKLGNLNTKNRLIRSATWEGIANPDGSVTDEAYKIYDELAKGGVGAIITGFTSVALHDNYFGGMMRLCDDALIPQYKKLTDIIHAHGIPVITQLALGGYYRSVNYNIGDTLNSANIDFIYAQTNDAFGQIKTINMNTGKEEMIGSWNERFEYTDEDIDAYLSFAEKEGYEHIILAGHSLGANKVIYYLSRHHDPRVEHFFFLSPANLDYMMSGVTEQEKRIIKEQVELGH